MGSAPTMSVSDAREIMWMHSQRVPVFGGPMSRGAPEPELFGLMVDWGRWERVPGSGYVPTKRAVEEAVEILKNATGVTPGPDARRCPTCGKPR